MPCLIAKLEAAGIDVAILDGARMRTAHTVTADIQSYDTITAPDKPKRGRPKGSKNKPHEKTAGEALGRQSGDAEVGPEISPTKIRNLSLIIWRLLENDSDHARGEWGDRAFLAESETAWLQSVDRKQPKLGDYHEARQIELRVSERRKKKWEQQKKNNGSYERSVSHEAAL